MAGKDTITPIFIIQNGDMSQPLLTSLPVKIQGFDNFGIQMIYTGAPMGTFNFNVSQNGTAWATLPDSLFNPAGPIQATGTGDDIAVDLNQLGFAYLQVTYTSTSGSGTLNVQLTAKLI